MNFLQQLILSIAPAFYWVIIFSCIGLWIKYFVKFFTTDLEEEKREKIRKKHWKIFGKD